MAIQDKDLRDLLEEIAKTIVELTLEAHKPERDVVSELHGNQMIITKLLGKAAVKIRDAERRNKK